MERFVIIKTRMSALNPAKDPYADILALLPANTPFECLEKPYESLEAAIADNTGFEVMSVTDFNAKQKKMKNDNKSVFTAMKLRTRELRVQRDLDRLAKENNKR